MRIRLTVVLAAALLGLAACGDDDGDDGGATEAESPCDEATAPEPKQLNLDPPPAQPPPGKLTAVIDTSCGTIEIALDSDRSPKTVASFVHLAENGVYDGTAWDRIIPGFIIQGGDPTATGSGLPDYFVDEPPPPDAEYTRGVVAMAKTEVEPPGRSGSTFFIVSAADAGLPPDYAVLGEVTSGMPVVKTIEQFGDPQAGPEGTPLDVVLIDSVTIEEG